MARLSQILLAGMMLIATAMPVQAQEAAYDEGSHAGGTGALPGQHQIHMQPQQTVPTQAAAENHSNLRHWSRFSTSSAKPLFIRVAPGAKIKGASEVSHYVRPTCVEPGKAVVAQKNNPNGPVQRYLAYNVPINTGARRVSPAATVATNTVKKSTAKKTPLIQVLGYGPNHTFTVSHTARAPKPAISCYASYH